MDKKNIRKMLHDRLDSLIEQAFNGDEEKIASLYDIALELKCRHELDELSLIKMPFEVVKETIEDFVFKENNECNNSVKLKYKPIEKEWLLRCGNKKISIM